MYPEAFLLLLLLAGSSSESTATVPYDNVGMKFIAVFPENIASYHPSTATNMVQITALFDTTDVTVEQKNIATKFLTLMAGEVWNVSLLAELELDKDNISKNILNITSNNTITVQAISLKQDSMQTALIIPTEKLSTTYLIPPIPTIPGTTDPNLVVKTVTERNPFKLIIVNGGDSQNTVTVTGSATTQVSLQPGQVAQIWLEDSKAFKNVTAVTPVAVLFGHPCAIRANCSCGMLYTVLPPAPDQNLMYLVPPSLAMSAEEQTVVLLATRNSTSVVPYSANTAVYQIAGTAILYRPGLLISLIPEANFGACFVIVAIPGCENNAVIVVPKNAIDGVHVGNTSISNPNWQNLQGTDYCSTNIPLQSGKQVIWHSYSKMAVYFGGNNGKTMFGNPAPMISSTPDFRGCAVIPEVLQVAEQADGWRESLQNCKTNNLELISMSNGTFQKHVYTKLAQTNSSSNYSMQDVWIGMRRRSLNGEWYWVNGDNVIETNWDQNKPSGVDGGQCAIMNVVQGKGFYWRDEDCCTAAHPVCYKKPTLLPI